MPPKPRPKAAKPKAEPKAARTPHDKIIDEIVKEFGQVLISGDDLIDNDKLVIPVSPSFDFAHNGGWQEGTFIVLVGPPRCGKTTTALDFAERTQRPEYGSHHVIYANAEARLEKRDLKGIVNIKTDRDHFTIIQSTPPEKDENGNIVKPGRILTAKDFLTIIEKFLINTTKKVIILDSVSAMMGESEWNDGLDSVAIGEAQRLFSKFMRRMSQVIATNEHIFIGIVHLYSNVGGGPGPKWLEKMSNSANYGLATKFRATHFDSWAVGPEKTVVGQIGHWKCERSPLGQPGIVVDSHLRYGQGIDKVQEIIGYAIDLKMIDKPKDSTYYKLSFVGGDKPPNIQGVEKVRSYLIEHPDLLADLQSKVYEGLGLPL